MRQTASGPLCRDAVARGLTPPSPSSLIAGYKNPCGCAPSAGLLAPHPPFFDLPFLRCITLPSTLFYALPLSSVLVPLTFSPLCYRPKVIMVAPSDHTATQMEFDGGLSRPPTPMPVGSHGLPACPSYFQGRTYVTPRPHLLPQLNSMPDPYGVPPPPFIMPGVPPAAPQLMGSLPFSGPVDTSQFVRRNVSTLARLSGRRRGLRRLHRLMGLPRLAWRRRRRPCRSSLGLRCPGAVAYARLKGFRLELQLRDLPLADLARRARRLVAWPPLVGPPLTRGSSARHPRLRRPHLCRAWPLRVCPLVPSALPWWHPGLCHLLLERELRRRCYAPRLLARRAQGRLSL